MKNVKKTLYIAGAIILSLLLSYWAGVYTGSRIRSAKLEARIIDSERTVEQLTESNRQLTKKLNNANDRASELETESDRLAEQNKKYAESIGNISGGIGEVESGLEGIERAIDFYLDQVKE
jgi:FtsZ-binding cell division protein ZapB